MPAGTLLLVVALYTRLLPQDVLRSPSRRRIHAAIAARPGILRGSLAEAVGLRQQSVSHHVQILEKSGYVAVRRSGNKTLHFATDAGIEEANRELLALEPGSTTMRVLLHVVRRPGAIRKSVAAATGITRTGSVWHVNKLLRLGLLREERADGRLRLFADPERVGVLLRLHGLPPDAAGAPPGP